MFSACKLIIENNRNLSASGTACLVAKEEVRLESGASLTTVADAKLYSANIVTLQKNTNLDIGGTLEMVSTQATGDARVNIRSNTTLNVGGDLYMRALRQAKVGHHANITVGETFTIISNGETLAEEDSDWSSIAYDSVIDAKRLSVASYEKVSIGARTIVNTDSIYLNALDCKIGATSQINSITKEGNCFSGLHPDARFRTTPIGGGEAPLQLFINGDRSTTPTGNIVAYHWEFVGLGTVTTTIPTTYYTFNEPGTYRIRLQVENSDGLKNTTSRKIIVTGDANQAPTSSFIISDTDILVGESITVDASNSTDDYQIRKYHWSLSNGASLTTRDPIANFTFNEIGNVDISLIVEDFFGVESEVSTQTITVNSDTNGIPASAYFNVDLFPTFTGLDIYNRSIAGDGEIVELYYLVDGIRYDLYDFTYGSRINLQNISHDGDIEVSIFVTDSLGNQSSLTKTFVMNNTVKPIASFELEQSNSLTAYVKAIKSYDPLNDINSISIDWGDGAVESINPTSLYLTHQYLQAGDYNVTLTINTTRGESNSLTKTISIIDGAIPSIFPTALFEVQKDPALGHVRVYVSESGTPNGSITGYSWQMGDGNVIEGLDQVAYFYDVGVYPVTLTITDSLGLTSSQTQTIVITENGDPLVISPQCSTNSNTLTADCVTYVAHRFAQFNNLQVDWGDGSVENFSPLNPYASLYDSLAHTYSEAGSYTATFYATAANGDTATVTREFYFDSGNMRPTGYITCNSNGLTVFCNGTGSYDPDGFITHYEFEVAQGNVIFSQDGQLSFTYPQAGTYEISLVAYDQLGLASIPVSTTVTIEQINNPPVAQLNCNSDSAFKVSCDAIGSYDSDGGIYTYEYIFYGDTIESVVRNTDSSFNYYFESAGNKRIDLIVTDDKGTSATTTINVDVLDNIAPVAAFSCSSTVAGQLDCDGSSSSDSDGSIASYFWTIGGVSYQGQDVSASGLSGESTTVQLRVVDNLGADNITSDNNVFVKQVYPPVAVASCVETDILTISCSGTGSSDPDNQTLSYSWSFSDGGSATGKNVNYTYSINTQDYFATLIVTDTDGASSSQTVQVYPAPAPSPIVAFACTQDTNLTLSCTSSGTQDSYGTIVDYFWDIDGQSYSGQDVTVEFNQATTATVNLTVNSSTGAIGIGSAVDYIVYDDGSGVGISETIVELQGINVDSFNQKSSQLLLNISNGALAINLDGDAEYLDVDFNDELLSNDELNVSTNFVEINRDMVEGLNRLTISFKDDLGKKQVRYFEFIAGSNSASITLADINNSPLSLSRGFLILEDYPRFVQESVNGVFSNIPSGNVKILGISDNSDYGAINLNINGNLSSINITSYDLSAINQGTSLDFELGTDGTQAFVGSLTTEVHDNSTSLIDYDGTKEELELVPDSSGALIIGGRYNLVDGATLPLRLSTNNIGDSFLVAIKEVSTGNIDFKLINSKALGYFQEGNLLTMNASDISVPSGESELFIFANFKSVVRGSRSSYKSIFSTDRIERSSLNILPQSLPQKIDVVELFDINPGFIPNGSPREFLYGVSLGNPRVLSKLVPFFKDENNDFKNTIELKVLFKDSLELGVDEELVLGIASVNALPLQFKKLEEVISERRESARTYHVDISDFALDQLNANLYLINRKISSGEVTEVHQLTNFDKSYSFPVSIHFGDFMLPVNDNFNSDVRFGVINYSDGYATWISPEYLDEFTALKNTNIVKFNDMSSLNLREKLRADGTNRRGVGSHQYGNDADIRVVGTDSDSENIKSADTLETAIIMYNLGNSVIDNLRKIGITSVIDSDYDRYMKSRCMSDGRFAFKGREYDDKKVGIFQSIDSSHKDHYHLSFYNPQRWVVRDKLFKDVVADLESLYSIVENQNTYTYTKGLISLDTTQDSRKYIDAKKSNYQKIIIEDYKPSIDEIYIRYEDKAESESPCVSNCNKPTTIRGKGWYLAIQNGAIVESFEDTLYYDQTEGVFMIKVPKKSEKKYKLKFRVKRVFSVSQGGGYCVNRDSEVEVLPTSSSIVNVDTKAHLNSKVPYHLRAGVYPEVQVALQNSSTPLNVTENMDNFNLTWKIYYQDISVVALRETMPDYEFSYDSSSSSKFDYGMLPDSDFVSGDIYLVAVVEDLYTGQIHTSTPQKIYISCLDFRQSGTECVCERDSNSTFTYISPDQNSGGDPTSEITIDQSSGDCAYPPAKLLAQSVTPVYPSITCNEANIYTNHTSECSVTYRCDEGFSAPELLGSVKGGGQQCQNDVIGGNVVYSWSPSIGSFTGTIECGGLQHSVQCNYNFPTN